MENQEFKPTAVKIILMEKVQSSNIEAIGYTEDSKNLYIKYASGTYVYEGVEKEVYENLQKAESKGRFVNEHIKSNYKYNKL